MAFAACLRAEKPAPRRAEKPAEKPAPRESVRGLGTFRPSPCLVGDSPSPSAASLSPGLPLPRCSVLEAPEAPDYLCPELAVPQGSECRLMVPRTNGVVRDGRGVAVFKAMKEEGGRLVLSSASGEAVFAYCEEGRRGLKVFNHEGRAFGELRPDGIGPVHGFSITSQSGWRVRFRGDREGKHLNATDDHGRLLAVMEALDAESREVRMGPKTDVGLTVLAVLGIDLLRAAALEAF